MALLSASSALADPKCDTPESWPAAMAHVQLKNAGVLVNEDVDFSRTAVQQIASQPIGKALYRQVFKITFHLKTGKLIEVIAVSDASEEECSMSRVTVYRIAGTLPD
jgi:protein-disulfide isomerase